MISVHGFEYYLEFALLGLLSPAEDVINGHSFGFMGSSYIFLACGGYLWLQGNQQGWNGFFYFFIWAVGIAYCIISICQMLNVCGCPLPVELLDCNQGGGAQKEQPKQQQTTTSA